MKIVKLLFTRFGLVLLVVNAMSSCARPEAKTDRERRDRTEVQLLAPGVPVPDLEGADQDGKALRLRSYLGRILLVYFYPKDGTPGCTKEACAFRDAWQQFESAGVQVLGVSRDEASSHTKFAREHRIPFPLIADTDAKWANAFGVPVSDGKFNRVSFLFNRSGTLDHVYPRVDPGVHAEEVLQRVRALETHAP